MPALQRVGCVLQRLGGLGDLDGGSEAMGRLGALLLVGRSNVSLVGRYCVLLFRRLGAVALTGE